MIRRSLRVALAIFAVCVTSLPVLAAENWPDSVNDYVLKIRKTVHTTDMNGYAAAVKDPKGALLLDIREEGEYKAGHVPGTINIPRGLLEFRIWKALGYPDKVDTKRKIYLQCQTGGRATLAARDLKNIGFTNVVAVVMNFPDWEKQGRPVEK